MARTSTEGQGVKVTIEDNGQGFDIDKKRVGYSGRGLDNQQRWAQTIGGTVKWASGPTGASFWLWLPLLPKRLVSQEQLRLPA